MPNPTSLPLSPAALHRMLPAALDSSAEEGTRMLAMLWLGEMLDLERQLIDAVEAGSDARPESEVAKLRLLSTVALRSAGMLRASVREHRSMLEISKRARRRLRDLEHALTDLRRRATILDYLALALEGTDVAAADEAQRLRERIAPRLPSVSDVAHAVVRGLEPVRAELTLRLSEYAERRVVGQAPSRRSLAAHLAARVSEGAAGLQAAFIDGRYRRMRRRLVHQHAMLMPFAQRDPAIGRWYYHTMSAHASLSALDDVDALADLAAAHGLSALSAMLEAEGDALLTSFQGRWDADGSVVAKSAVDALDGSAAANALPMEIERKFLLRAAPPEIAGVDPIRIEQGWLPGSVLRERLRRSTHADGRTVLTRTVKAGPLGARMELEEPASAELFDAMWPHTRAARIRKHRYPIRAGRFVWEIDVFDDRDLVLAEVELTQAGDAPPFPDWLAPFVVRDVTDDLAYTNSVMATPDGDVTDGDARDASGPDASRDATLTE